MKVSKAEQTQTILISLNEDVAMPTTYTIHLRNKQSANQTFWCFLDEPSSNIDSTVFANSSAFLTVPTYSPGQDDRFAIPLQYVVQAGASNQAVGLNTQIYSSIKHDTDLSQTWLATYFAQNQGPNLTSSGSAPSGEIDITTNAFDKSKEPLNKWFSNLTYGVKSENGFMGVTWSPDPNQEYRIKPKVQFYVATGHFESNTLADITSISKQSASITDASFDGNNECTVTLNTDGTWDVVPGNLNNTSELFHQLMESHLNLSTAHVALVDLLAKDKQTKPTRSESNDAYAISAGVQISSDLADDANNVNNFITGTVTLKTAIAVGFAYMIASAIKVKIEWRSPNGLDFRFSYNGTAGSNAIKEAFKAGTTIDFSDH
ncbi:hypothetical protein [Enterobacter cloacae]|uniref:hypothetical protein n=1 Tax=Enterobacter cloacae TaxID=550 RepID=UPI002B1EEC92|nr:hypothetical protein [Enterobacter cloacae]